MLKVLLILLLMLPSCSDDFWGTAKYPLNEEIFPAGSEETINQVILIQRSSVGPFEAPTYVGWFEGSCLEGVGDAGYGEGTCLTGLHRARAGTLYISFNNHKFFANTSLCHEMAHRSLSNLWGIKDHPPIHGLITRDCEKKLMRWELGLEELP